MLINQQKIAMCFKNKIATITKKNMQQHVSKKGIAECWTNTKIKINKNKIMLNAIKYVNYNAVDLSDFDVLSLLTFGIELGLKSLAVSSKLVMTGFSNKFSMFSLIS